MCVYIGGERERGRNLVTQTLSSTEQYQCVEMCFKREVGVKRERWG